MGLEPTTSDLEGRHSTIELLLQTNKVEPEGVEPSTLGSSGQRSTN